MATSENIKAAASIVREEDLQDLENVLRDLQDRCDQAGQDGRIYMMQMYIRLIAIVSPEIDRIQRRFKRDSIASLRKTHKQLKASAPTE